MSLGIFNFWIEDQYYPGKCINLTLNSIIFSLKSNLAGVDNLQKDLGNLDAIEINFNNFNDDRLLWIDTGELYQYGLSMLLGFDRNNERIFYSTDFEKSYREIVLPKGVIKNTLMLLDVEYIKPE